MSDALEGIRACVFDAYGTLLDFNSAVAREGASLGDKAAGVSDLWRRKQLEYTWLRSLMQRHEPFWTVTQEALAYTLEAFGVADDDLEARLMAAYRTLDPYPEVPSMMASLKAGGMATAILSNGSPEMLSDGVAHAGLAASLDQVLSVEDVGIFKPSPEVYQLATSRLGVAAREIAFMSSNGWDVHGAASFGFRCIWINRAGAPRERLPEGPIKVLTSLETLPALVGPKA